VTITEANLAGLFLLSEEFGFEALAARLSEFRQSRKQFGKEDARTVTRISAPEERGQKRDHDFEMLQSALARIAALEEREQKRDHNFELSERRSDQITALWERGEQHEHDIEMVWRFLRFSGNHEHHSLGSAILPGLPKILSLFQGKHFKILWRGSHDGFGGSDFHRQCDGHRNTLTVILDTNGNIFEGFTPVEWESRKWNGKTGDENNCFKADDSLRSFLFTLKNPHDIPERRFALMARSKHEAIRCDSRDGPCFGLDTPFDFGDINIVDNCNTTALNYTLLGSSYTPACGTCGHTLFAGDPHFQVQESKFSRSWIKQFFHSNPICLN
jgi:hypothetical protein